MYWKLFISMFYLSAFTFGGGYVIVPMMKKKFVEQLKWIDENEMLDLIAIAQSLPGVLAVNASVLIGYRLKKIRGAIVSSFGTVLPPLIILAIITLIYDSFRSNPIVAVVLKGMQIGVGALIFTVVLQMTYQLFKDKNKVALIMLVLSVLASIVFKINTVVIIIATIIFATVIAVRKHK